MWDLEAVCFRIHLTPYRILRVIISGVLILPVFLDEQAEAT
jgi:hypothetical protein